jgi:transposase InsO family protein
VTETLLCSLKVERLHEMRLPSPRREKDEVLGWLTFYNCKRLHSTLGYMSQMAFEKKWLAGESMLVA